MTDKFTAIIIDDSEKTVELIATAFEDLEEFQVLGYATNGQDALDAIKSLKPDLITLDINMPIINGIELLKTIKENNITVKTIVISGVLDPDTLKELMDIKPDYYIEKPFQGADLRGKVKKLFNIDKDSQDQVPEELRGDWRNPDGSYSVSFEPNDNDFISNREKRKFRPVKVFGQVRRGRIPVKETSTTVINRKDMVYKKDNTQEQALQSTKEDDKKAIPLYQENTEEKKERIDEVKDDSFEPVVKNTYIPSPAPETVEEEPNTIEFNVLNELEDKDIEKQETDTEESSPIKEDFHAEDSIEFILDDQESKTEPEEVPVSDFEEKFDKYVDALRQEKEAQEDFDKSHEVSGTATTTSLFHAPINVSLEKEPIEINPDEEVSDLAISVKPPRVDLHDFNHAEIPEKHYNEAPTISDEKEIITPTETLVDKVSNKVQDLVDKLQGWLKK